MIGIFCNEVIWFGLKLIVFFFVGIWFGENVFFWVNLLFYDEGLGFEKNGSWNFFVLFDEVNKYKCNCVYSYMGWNIF